MVRNNVHLGFFLRTEILTCLVAHSTFTITLLTLLHTEVKVIESHVGGVVELPSCNQYLRGQLQLFNDADSADPQTAAYQILRCATE